MKKHGNIGVYAVETGIHSASFYNEVKAEFDSVIEMKLEEADGELRASSESTATEGDMRPGGSGFSSRPIGR